MDNSTQKMKKRTLERVRNYGRMGESFDKAVNRLMDKVEENAI